MSKIELTTFIKAPIEVVFNNARNIDIHTKSTNTNEKAIEGKTNGLIEKGQTVTWQGVHFGLTLQHQSIISEMQFPFYFEDIQLRGHFKFFRHRHFFEQNKDTTTMKDILEYEAPYFFIGKILDHLFLKRHFKSFLSERNQFLKDLTEHQQ